jgi:hypothetical protein
LRNKQQRCSRVSVNALCVAQCKKKKSGDANAQSVLSLVSEDSRHMKCGRWKTCAMSHVSCHMCHVLGRHTHEHSAEIIMDMEKDDQVGEYVMNGGRQGDGGRGRRERGRGRESERASE